MNHLRIEKVAPKIYAVIGPTSKAVASVMIRLQENYESPKFRNKVFTLDEFIPWYTNSQKKETFTYFNDWSGFNVPGYIVKRFLNGKFNPLSREELWLVKAISELNIRSNFYLLGYAESAGRTKKHEIAHGLFYTNRKYKQEVLDAMKNHNTNTGKLPKLLRKYGYCDNVLLDEYHAWTLTDSALIKKHGAWSHKLDILKEKLEHIYRKYNIIEKELT